jgi:mannitol/fructose-specific phosphotransferase system IIA component (Ntr-type)
MHLLRYLRPAQVLLELESALTPPDVAEHLEALRRAEESGGPVPDPPETRDLDEHGRWRRKEAVVRELARLLDRSDDVRNLSKLTRDLLDRERKSTTAVGGRLAIPHVRSMQPRRLVVCLARSRVGAEYLAEDGRPVHVFFCIAAPSYDDADYWKLYRWAANAFGQEAWLVDAVLEAPDENEILRVLKSLR